MPDSMVSHFFLAVKKLSKAVRKTCNPDAVEHISDDDISDIGINLVRSHYKFHIIPRFRKDGTKHFWNRKGDKGLKVREKYAREIKNNL